MKKRLFPLKSILVLIVMLCASLPLLAQGSAVAATTSLDERVSATVKPSTSLKMIVRQGDVNGDCQVTISDVTQLVSMLLTNSGYNWNYADVNKDNQVTISDVTALIQLLLTGNTEYTVADAQQSLNDVYRTMYTAGWSTMGNTHQCFGISAYNLMAEVMGDDMIMASMGNGWFWYDASYNVKTRYIYSTWRSYDLWNAYYTWITNANYVLTATSSMNQDDSDVKYVRGQAYAIRAYSYFMLAQSFARTYKGHENEPCVPLMAQTRTAEPAIPVGGTRATVAEVYAQIDADLAEAINLLNGIAQHETKHISYAVAQGLRARVALVKEEWNTAYSAAMAAINNSGKTVQEVSAFMGLNDVNADNVLWGPDIPIDGVGMYASFFTHMSSEAAYGQSAPKQITTWLYDKMNDSDARRAWWDPENSLSNGGYVQKKFEFSNKETWEGDYIWMRIEEMYLTAAEAACRLGLTNTATNRLMSVMSKRDPNYTCNKTGTDLGALTNDETGSLLEEILIQRRIELWGEDGRIYTIRRLRQGFERNSDDGWPTSLLLTNFAFHNPESYSWVMTIPQAEFDGNPSLNPAFIPVGDQNPLGDFSILSQNVSFAAASQDITTSRINYTATVELTRSSNVGQQVARLYLVDGSTYASLASSTASFADGSYTTSVRIYFENMSLDNHYSATLALSSSDVGTGSEITRTTVNVTCTNLNPEGQHISFQNAFYPVMTEESSTSVPIVLKRAVTDNEYTALLILTGNDGHATLQSQYVTFMSDEDVAWTYLNVNGMETGNTYRYTIKLSDADIATADPSLDDPITTTVVEVVCDIPVWLPAGTCIFNDKTWDDCSAGNIPIENMQGTNIYRIVSPLAYVYPANYSYGQGDDSDWRFTLNADGSISPMEGEWDLYYWGYNGYWNSNYPNYCYVTQDGNTYDVTFMLLYSGNYYTGGNFSFTWTR